MKFTANSDISCDPRSTEASLRHALFSLKKKTRCNGRIADAADCRQEGSAATELVWYLLPITRPPRYNQEKGNHRTNQTELGGFDVKSGI